MSNQMGPKVSGQIELDTKDLTKAVKDISNFEKSMMRAVNQINQGNTNLANSVNKLVSTFSSVNTTTSKTTQAINDSSNSMKQYAQSTEQVSGSLTQTINAVNRTEVALMKMENRIKKSSLEDENKSQALTSVQSAAGGAVQSIEKYGAKSSQAAVEIAKFKKAQAQANIEVTNANRSFRGQAFDEMATKFRNVSTSVVLALGPLSGVASRLVALQALFTRNAAALAGFLAGLTGLTVTLNNAFKASVDAQTQFLRMESTLSSMGIRAKTTATDIMELGHAVAAVTLTSAKDARDGALAISSFSNVATDSYERVLITAQGMAEQLGGGLADNAKLLARALQDPEKRLTSLERKVGDFSAVTRRAITDMARQGDVAGAQALIMEQLADKYDLATAAAGGYAGAVDTTSGLIDRFYERIALQSGAMDAATDQVNLFNDSLEKLVLGETADKLGNLLTNAINLAGGAINYIARNAEILHTVMSALVGLVMGRVVMSLGMAAAGAYSAAAAYIVKSKAVNVATRSVGIFSATLTALMGPMGLLRLVMMALAPLMGGMITRFITTGKAAVDVTKDVREYRAELDNLIKASNELANIDPNLRKQAEALGVVTSEYDRLERQINQTQMELAEFENATKSLSNDRSLRQYGVKTRAEFNRLFLSAYSVSQGFTNAANGNRILGDSYDVLTGAMSGAPPEFMENTLIAAKLQNQLDGLQRSVHDTKAVYDDQTKSLRENAEAVDALREQIDGVMMAITGWANAYDAEAQAARRLQEDLDGVTKAIAVLDAGIELAGENVAVYTEEKERLLRIQAEIEKRIRGEKDVVNELTASYSSLTNNLRVLTRDTDNLRNVFLGGEDMSFFNSVQDQVDSAKEAILSLNDFEIQTLGETLGIAQGTMELELYRQTVASVYGEKLALEVEAQKRLNDQIQLQREVDQALTKQLPTVLEMESAYESLFDAATKLGDSDRMKALEDQYAEEQRLLEQSLNKMLEFRLGMSTQEIAELRESRRAQLEEMYGAEHERYVQFLEDMAEASRQANVFAGVMEAAGETSDYLGGLMNVMRIQNREQSKEYQAFAKAQVLISAAMGIGKAIPMIPTNPFKAFADIALISATAGAQVAAISAQNYATGGYVQGAGTGTSDSIPARLSNGEFVLKASAVQQLGVPFLNALNEGRSVGLKSGGMVGNVPAPSGGGSSVNIQIIDQRASGGAPITTEESTSPDGIRNIRVIVRDIMNEIDASGERDKSMAANFGVTRQPRKR